MYFTFGFPLVPKLSPDDPTTCGMQLVSKLFIPSFSFILKDITLFMALVSKRVLILRSVKQFVKIGNTVDVVGPSSSML